MTDKRKVTMKDRRGRKKSATVTHRFSCSCCWLVHATLNVSANQGVGTVQGVSMPEAETPVAAYVVISRHSNVFQMYSS